MDEEKYKEFKIFKAKKIFFSEFLIRLFCKTIPHITEWQDRFISATIHVHSKNRDCIEKDIARILNAINCMQEQGIIDRDKLLKYVSEEHDKCLNAVDDFVERMLEKSENEFN